MSNPLRILIVDDNQMMAKTLRDIFTHKGYQVEVAYSGPEALEKIQKQAFDCVLSDIKMPEVDGIELYRSIKAQRPTLPVVLMTAYTTDKRIEEGLAEGVIGVLTKPLNIRLLLNFFAYLNQERSVVIIDDDPAFCQTLGDILNAHGFEVHQATKSKEAVGKIKENIQVVLLDMKLNGRNGLELLKAIKAMYPKLPVIVVTGYKDEVASALDTALELSAYTYFYKPLQIDELLQTLTEIHHQELGRRLKQTTSKKG